MRNRTSLSATFTLLALLTLLALAACGGGTPPTQSTASNQQLQATIEALQTKVVEQDREATPEPIAEGAQEPEATEAPVDASTEEATEVPYVEGGTPLPPGEVPPGPLTVVALGDSLTQGDGDEPGEGGGYPLRIERAINEVRPDSQVINLGQSGWDSGQMVEGQLPDALQANPHIALVWIGSNDLWYNNGPDQQASDVDRYTNNIDTTLRALTGAGARVYIALLDDQSKRPFALNPDGFGLSPEGAEHMSSLGMAFNDVLRAKAAEYGATTVDFYNATIFTDPSTLADDGLHPNAEGYDLIAPIWFEAILQDLE